MFFLLFAPTSASAGEVAVYEETFGTTTSTLDGTDGWETNYSSDVWAVGSAGAYAKTDDRPGSTGATWGTGVMLENYVWQDAEGPWTDFTLEVDFEVNDNDGVGVVFNRVDTKNTYLLWLSRDHYPATAGTDATGSGSGLYEIRSKTTGTGSTATSLKTSTTTYTVGTSHTLKVTVDSGQIDAWLDGTKFISATDSSALGDGAIGLLCYDNGDGATDGCSFTNVKVSLPDADDDGSPDVDDCDDADPTAYPEADETCDGVDNDCDGEIDEDAATDVATWFRDADGDTFGSATVTDIDCDKPTGYVTNDDDCDDADASEHPGAAEVCDGDDDDCDGATDEADAKDAATWHLDADGDSFGAVSPTTKSCNKPSGYVEGEDDCDDTNPKINPDALERCNGVDDDCDLDVDEDVTTSDWWPDDDGDGFGDRTATPVSDCHSPADGWTDLAGDCDDDDGAVNPDARERCDDVDEDCDGVVDDDPIDGATYWPDADRDAYGKIGAEFRACDPGDAATQGGDCDDDAASVHPGATEIPGDEIDQDCDGTDAEDTDDPGDTDTEANNPRRYDPFLETKPDPTGCAGCAGSGGIRSPWALLVGLVGMARRRLPGSVRRVAPRDP